MCSTCGCGEADVRVTTPGAAPGFGHGHGHGHGHGPEHSHDIVHLELDDELRTHTLELEVAVLAKNDGLAAHNRGLADRTWDHRTQPDELAREQARRPCSNAPSPRPSGLSA